MNNTKKLVALFLCLVCLFSCTGCYTLFGVTTVKSGENEQNVRSEADGRVNVLIVVGEYEPDKEKDAYDFYRSDTLDLVDGQNAGEYFLTVCKGLDIPCVGVDSGYITQIDEYVNDDVNAWLFYVNGELSDVGIKEVIPTDGDDIVLSYVDWTEVFGA